MSTVVGHASGHAAIIATHHKTLEITRAAQIGGTASCVVAVAGAVDERALAALRGRVELTLSVGGRSVAIGGRLNPAFRPGDPLVVRRSPQVTRDAVLIAADRVAADLDPALVVALATPGADVRLAFSELGGAVTGALVVDLLDGWRAANAEAGDAPDLTLATPLEEPEVAGALALLATGARVALDRRPGDERATRLVAQAQAAGHAVLPAPGLAPVAAALAVTGAPVARLEFGRHGRRKPQALPPGTTRVIVDVPGDRVAEHLVTGHCGLVVVAFGGPREQFLPWRDGEEPRIEDARHRRALVVVHAGDIAPDGLPLPVARLAEAMIANGLSVRDTAQAVADATGMQRRTVYDRVLEIRDSRT